jgi:hypothetical protein
MRNPLLVAAACAAAFSAAAIAASPLDQLKSKMKEGLYETTVEMEMPGMPANKGKQATTYQKCVTAEDLEKGGAGRDGKAPEKCEMKNFKMSGNTASYTMVCSGKSETTADSKITFGDGGYKMDMKMTMNRNGKVMNTTHHMESRYLGPCKK